MLDKTISQRRFAVVDVRDDRKITYMTEFSHCLVASKGLGTVSNNNP
jgi:hypothetical protein